MSGDVVIRVENLWKSYGFRRPAVVRRGNGWIRRLLSKDAVQTGPLQSPGGVLDENTIWALRDVSFKVRKGDTVALLGRNGSGKSTLLKVLAGVCPPTYGRVEVKGSIFPMIQLNAGMHPELTGRENTRIIGSIMRLTRRDMESRMQKIQDFCELGDWFDEKIRKYSSGMIARLGFAVAVNTDADILLIDEVWAVGDLSFQKRSMNAISEMYQSGEKTVILVTHEVRRAERVCNVGIDLRRGSLVLDSTVNRAVAEYYRENIMDRIKGIQSLGQNRVYTIQDTGEVQFSDFEFLDHEGKPTDTVETGRSMKIRARYEFKESMPSAVFHFGFSTSDMLRLSIFNSVDSINMIEMETEGVVECTIEDFRFMPGIYSLIVIVEERAGGRRLFHGENLAFVQVHDSTFEHIRYNMGLMSVNADWKFYQEQG